MTEIGAGSVLWNWAQSSSMRASCRCPNGAWWRTLVSTRCTIPTSQTGTGSDATVTGLISRAHRWPRDPAALCRHAEFWGSLLGGGPLGAGLARRT
jgi:hypothetical protein